MCEVSWRIEGIRKKRSVCVAAVVLPISVIRFPPGMAAHRPIEWVSQLITRFEEQVRVVVVSFRCEDTIKSRLYFAVEKVVEVYGYE